MAEKSVFFFTIKQWTAALLLMLSLGIVSGRGDFDQPHHHSDCEPTFPTTLARSVYTNTSAGMNRLNSLSGIPEAERCLSCAGLGIALVSHSLTMPICHECMGTGRNQA